jgi:drug/metabolite transporter (DMT)-like permease
MEVQGKTLSRYRGFDGPGRWLPWISVAVYGLASYVGLRLSEGFHFGPPGDERPWYFLRNDFVIGASLGVGIAVCLAIAYLARKRYPLNASACLWMSVLWSGGSAWKAAVIWMGSHNLMNPALATTRWPNFEAYFRDPVIWAGQILILGGVVLFAERRLRKIG